MINKTSHGGTGSQSRAVIDRPEADLVGLALGRDVLKIQQSGLIDAGWEKALHQESSISHSLLAARPVSLRTLP